MKRFRSKLRSIRHQFLMLLVIFLICTVGIAGWSMYSSYEIQMENLDYYLDLYAAQLTTSTRQAYESYESIAYSVAYSNLVQEYMKAGDPADRYQAYQVVYNFLSNTASLNLAIADIAVISDAGNSISLNASPTVYADYMERFSDFGSSAFASLGTGSINGETCQILAMPIHRLTTTGQSERLGTAFLAISGDRFFTVDLAANRADMPEIVYVDASGTRIFGSPSLYEAVQELSNDVTKEIVVDHVRYRARSFFLSSSTGSLYVLFETEPYIRSYVNVSMRQILLQIGALSVVFLFYLYRWMEISRALTHLKAAMDKITGGERRTMNEIQAMDRDAYGSTEIRDIYQAFNDMMSEINGLNMKIYNNYTQMYEMEMNNRQTEIAYLRSQINPHFLYNTLTTICGLSQAGMNEAIVEVTNALSRIFRYSIQGSDMVTLDEELSIVRSYLMIQSYRFEDRFSVQYEIEEATRTLTIPKMVIQPLVENAIIHGLEPSLHRGKIIISSNVEKKAGELSISILDTGVGMTKEQLTTLQTQLSAGNDVKSASSKGSIGLSNVNSRLILYYGHEYGLKLESWEKAGTRIVIHIPPVDPKEPPQELPEKETL